MDKEILRFHDLEAKDEINREIRRSFRAVFVTFRLRSEGEQF
jgi:hypothetical protein